jgi:hypothetical protein
MKTATFVPMALAATLLAGTAMAQATTPPTGAAPARPTPGATAPRGDTAPGATGNAPTPGTSSTTGVTPNTGAADRNPAAATTAANAPQPARGRNSFTEGEARRRIERNGYQNVTGLKKDDNGVWRGTATKGGESEAVWLDYKGNVGPHPTPTSSRSGVNPPGTVGGRATDRSLGTGAPGTNPPGATPGATPGGSNAGKTP